MVCPKCKGKIKSLVALNVDNNEIFRRKKCNECGHVFYTCEFEVEYTAQFKKEWKMNLYNQDSGV